MQKEDFLRGILPPSGYYCVVGIKDGKVRQQLVESIERVVEQAEAADAKGWNAYFALASFHDTSTRAGSNVSALRSFFIDLDCGTGKPYVLQSDALVALKKFAVDIELPLPVVVNSGRGIHAYWPLNDAVSLQDWLPVAEAFKKLAIEQGLQIDPAVTADAARVLRVPGTRNTKNNEVVTVLHEAEAVDFLHFRDLVSAKVAITAQPIFALSFKPEYDPITEALMGNYESKFRKILSGGKCEQLSFIATNQTTIPEPLWRAGLSIAQHCADRNIAIHKISDQHPGYNRNDTEYKASQIKGPYTCATFDTLNPGVCTNCEQKGKVTSPIVLGRVVKEYRVEDQPNDGEKINGHNGHDHNGYEHPILASPNPIYPRLPQQYFRGANGGIYTRIKKDDEEIEDLIYKYDLWATKRYWDPGLGDVIEVFLKLPHDEERKFIVPAADLVARDTSKKTLAYHGVALGARPMEKVVQYMIDWVDLLEQKNKSEKSRSQMGWTEDETFILGDKEITPAEHRYTPPGKGTMSLVSALGQKGSLEEWERVANYYGKEGMEVQAFALLMGFGAVLFKFTHHQGGIVNLISKDSGSGKSTLLAAINSIYGNPGRLMLMWKDTMNSLMHRIGIMNNLPVPIDENTNWKPEQSSDFAYHMTQGRGKHRLESGANAERDNHISWQTVAICTANSSLYDKLVQYKAMPEAEMYRIIEMYMPRTEKISKVEADDVFHKLNDNYGHAGLLFIDFVVKNLPLVKETLREIQKGFDKQVNMGSAERYWSAMIACALTAGHIVTNDLGLLKDFNMPRIYRFMVTYMDQIRQSMQKISFNGTTVLSQYLMKVWYLNTLVIDSRVDKRSAMQRAPDREPRAELIIRYEPDVKRLYVPVTHFRTYCVEKHMPFGEIIKYLREHKVIIGQERKRLDKGARSSSPGVVDVLVVDASHEEFNLQEVEENAVVDDDQSK